MDNNFDFFTKHGDAITGFIIDGGISLALVVLVACVILLVLDIASHYTKGRK